LGPGGGGRVREKGTERDSKRQERGREENGKRLLRKRGRGGGRGGEGGRVGEGERESEGGEELLLYVSQAPTWLLLGNCWVEP
jgi:ribosomal protein L15